MEKVLLVVVISSRTRTFQVKETTSEMEQLIASSSGTVIATITARIDKPSASHYLRKGKLAQLKDMIGI